MSEPLVQLNANWRIADDPPQWTIKQRIGNPSAKDSGWRARRNTDHMLRRIGEMCGDVDPMAIETIESWPNGYATWKLREMEVSAGPENAPDSAITSLGARDDRKQQAPPVATAMRASPEPLEAA